MYKLVAMYKKFNLQVQSIYGMGLGATESQFNASKLNESLIAQDGFKFSVQTPSVTIILRANSSKIAMRTARLYYHFRHAGENSKFVGYSSTCARLKAYHEINRNTRT